MKHKNLHLIKSKPKENKRNLVMLKVFKNVGEINFIYIILKENKMNINLQLDI